MHAGNLPLEPGRDRGILSALGFTLIEMLMVIVLLGILGSVMVPQVSRFTTRAKVRETAGTVAGDLEQAVTLAGRLRKPVTLSWSGSTYQVRDRATSPSDTIRLQRTVAFGSDFGVRRIEFSPASVVIFPNGLVSAAVSVEVESDGFGRVVTLSPAGLVRIQ